MIPASVGFQCPECVRAGSKTIRQARTPFGGAMTAPDKAPITFGLIGVNILMFVLTGLGSGATFDKLTLIPGPVLDQSFHVQGVAHGQYYRLLTSMFMHFSFFHIAVNMYSLYVLGPSLERILGRWRFVALYFVSGLGGSVATYLFADFRSSTAGASGAIFGLLGAFFVVARKVGANTNVILGTLVANLFITFGVPGISKTGHLGGLAFGAILAAIYAYVPPGPRRTQLHLAGVAVLSAALVVLTAVGPS